jgi:hypothetical protein
VVVIPFLSDAKKSWWAEDILDAQFFKATGSFFSVQILNSATMAVL